MILMSDGEWRSGVVGWGGKEETKHPILTNPTTRPHHQHSHDHCFQDNFQDSFGLSFLSYGRILTLHYYFLLSCILFSPPSYKRLSFSVLIFIWFVDLGFLDLILVLLGVQFQFFFYFSKVQSCGCGS